VGKLKPNEKRVQLSFVRTEDVSLHEWMAAKAYAARLTLPDFILLSLQQAFPADDRDSASPPETPE
jgi:hypothetical protein